MKLCGYVVLKEEEYIKSLGKCMLRGFDFGCKATEDHKAVLFLGKPIRRKKMPTEEIGNTCEEAQERACQPDAPDWKNRFRLEYHEVKARYIKLHNIIVKLEAGTCEFKPNCSLDLLKRQAKVMGEYLFVLEIRAQIENVVL